MSNTERELLKLAAKAAGIADGDFFYDMERGKVWNPRDDDGDSRRLQVKLRLTVMFDDRDNVQVSAADAGAEHCKAFAMESIGNNPDAAVRLAVLRAAAEIGKAME